MDSLKFDYDRYVMPTYGRFDLDLVRGHGCVVEDVRGKSYLDFGAGIAVCSLGHSHPEVTRAVCEQAALLVHTSNLYRTIPQARLAKRLVEITGAGKVFFCNSGAEANEGLIKLARKFGSATGRTKILTFQNSFHGRTMACISATGQDKVKKGFEPLLSGFLHLPFCNLDAVRSEAKEDVCAVLVEPIQGEGGIHIASPEFLRGLREICNEHKILLLFDEVQCGLGRTGDFCAWRTICADVEPDGVSWAKGIANGFPLGAFWATNRPLADEGPICDLLGPGSHGTTYGGNPVSCAAALAVLNEINEKNLLENVRLMGRRLLNSLQKAGVPCRGIGLMVGILIPSGVSSRTFVEQLHLRGLLSVSAGESVVRLLPPLNVSAEEIDQAVAIVLDAWSACELEA